jgi:hypothetical protein
MRVVCGYTVHALPGMHGIETRLRGGRIRTRAETPEASGPTPAGEEAGDPGMEGFSGPFEAVIRWSGAPASPAAITAALGDLPLADVGGAESPETDRERARALAGPITGQGGIAILVKAWEPPLLELLDFLQEFRGTLPDTTPLVIFPLAPESDGRLVPGKPDHRATWRRRVGTVGDPWIRVANLEERSAP